MVFDKEKTGIPFPEGLKEGDKVEFDSLKNEWVVVPVEDKPFIVHVNVDENEIYEFDFLKNEWLIKPKGNSFNYPEKKRKKK